MGPAMGSGLVSSRLLNRDLSGFVRSIQGILKIRFLILILIFIEER